MIEPTEPKPEQVHSPKAVELIARVATSEASTDNNNTVDRVMPRVDKVNNKVFAAQGGAKLIQPDSRLIAAITADQEKAHYIPTAGTEAFRHSDYSHMGEPEYSRSVFGNLLDVVFRDLVEPEGNSRLLSFRATMGSLNGTIDSEFRATTQIADIMQIIQAGKEINHDTFNVANADLTEFNQDSTGLALHRVNQYAQKIGFIRELDLADVVEVDAIFPVVLVYDSAMLQTSGSNVWGARVRDEYSPDQALLGAYILDCPA